MVECERGRRSLSPAVVPAPDLPSPEEEPTPPAPFDRAPGHARREPHRELSGEEPVGVFDPGPEPSVPEAPAEEPEVFVPDEHGAGESDPGERADGEPEATR